MSDFWMNPEFASAANSFHDAGNAVSEQASGLTDGGAPWSDDKLGSAFGEKFVPDLHKVVKNLHDMATKLGNEGDVVTHIARSVVAADRNFGE